jgi:creatinine amidohydrolase
MVQFSSRYWSDYTSEAFSTLDRANLIAVLPVGATEQHGPHLPMSTDTATIDGMVSATLPKLPTDLPVLFLPTVAYGKSNEHARYPGTLTISAATLIQTWMELGACVARAGVQKFVMFNSHGGQMAVMDIVARDLRERHGLMAVAANWYTLGLPQGLFDEREMRHGIHAGDLETSIMMELTPSHVRPDKARDFGSHTEVLARENRFLSISPSGKLGWQMQDLNPAGAAGNATLARADKGRAVIDFVSSRFVELLQEIDRFDMRQLGHPPAWS